MSSPDQDAPRPPDWAAPTPSGAPSGTPSGTPAGSPAPGTGWGPAPGSGGPVPPGPGYGAPVPPAGYGGPAAPVGYGQPGAWGYGQVPPGHGGWRPPAAQPGIIPLRPLGAWELLDGAFRAIRANPRVMFGLSAIVVTVVVALQSVATWYLGGLLAAPLDEFASSVDATGEFGLAASSGSAIAALLTTPFVAMATTVLTGLLIVSVSRSVIGRTVSVREVNQMARGRIWWVLGFTVLLALAGLGVGVLLVAAVWALTAAEQWGAATALGLIGGVLVMIGAVWVTVRTLLVPPALMLEGTPFWATIRRAWRLTRGSFWRLLGIYLLVMLVTLVVSWIVATPVTVLSLLLFGTYTTEPFGSIVLTAVADILSQTLSTVFSAAVIALLYIDVRMRREGLDVELARAADEAPA